MLTSTQMQAAGMTNPTLTRVRGEVLVTITSLDDVAPLVAGDQANLYWGVAFQDAVTGAAGADFEDPLEQSYSPVWLWWSNQFLRYSGDDRDSVTSAVRIPVDIRAKRRVDPSDQLVLVAVNESPANQPVSCAMYFTGRCLFTGV